MKKHILIIALSLFLGACETMPEKATVDEATIETEAANLKSRADAEVDKLFAQKYIDPLTRYLQTHHEDSHLKTQFTKVEKERDKRCKKIKQRFAKKPKTAETLDKLKRGYAFSCLQVVKDFKQRLGTEVVVKNTETVAAEEKIVAETVAEPLAEQETAQTTEAEAEEAEVATHETSDTTTAPVHSLAECQQVLKQKNYAQALSYCQPLAKQGKAKAQFMLGQMYEQGKGVAKNDSTALDWYQQAAKQGHSAAQSVLGVRHYTGEGVVQDYSKAAYWQTRAANQGYPEAQFILGVMYELGQGVPQDFVLAYQWYLLATAQGAKGALESRQTLAGRLTSEQIAEAQRLAREVQAKE
ncbi:tetratricopeptide repeat protein [Candidatus Venteria ishoeyi]|uniref:tetratricopeptide repeat protein n=1 Tax=Candidatus Venteria ishoeyi TaxID=1899563 RepID=UPI0025A5F7BB|nr:tetratricopeptide repeat protein [Candidatus Venteria ishoeyi]MDM8545970.1 tetratricopeptide repeat protein [Candidatus Venteria ishoeyi]